MLSNPEITRIDPQHAVAIHATVPADRVGETMGQLFGEVYGYLSTQPTRPGMPFSLYHEPPGETITFDAGALVAAAVPGTDRIKSITLPGGRVVKAMHTGPYDTLAASYAELQAWVTDAGEQLGEVAWEVYLTDPDAEPDPAKWQTEIFWTLAPAVEGE